MRRNYTRVLEDEHRFPAIRGTFHIQRTLRICRRSLLSFFNRNVES